MFETQLTSQIPSRFKAKLLFYRCSIKENASHKPDNILSREIVVEDQAFEDVGRAKAEKGHEHHLAGKSRIEFSRSLSLFQNSSDPLGYLFPEFMKLALVLREYPQQVSIVEHVGKEPATFSMHSSKRTLECPFQLSAHSHL